MQETFYPPLRKGQMMNDIDTWLYAVARRVANIFYENVATDYGSRDPKKPWFNDCRHHPVEPDKIQTRTGLYLGFYSGIPSRLCTPWGVWNFARNGSYNSYQKAVLVDAVRSRLRIQVHQLRCCGRLGAGSIASYYGLLVVDGEALPPPSFREDDEFMPYGDAWAKWAELTTAYVPV
jgi:hypothetical protein